MDYTVYIIIALLAILVAGGAALAGRLHKLHLAGAQKPAPVGRVAGAADGGGGAEAQGGARRGAADRMRGRLRQRAQQQQQQQQQHDWDTGSSGGGSSEGEEEEEDGQPLTRRQRARRARREARAAEAAARDARGRKVSAYEERRRQRDAAREAQERAQDEAIAQEAAARAAREEEEAAKWMSQISVDKQGTGEAEDADADPGLLGQFVDYIVSRKMAPLEEVAREFGMRTTDVIDRISSLEAMGRLTGVMDERGKYIYISMEEMQAVAAHIRSKGRTSIAELAQESSSLGLINFEAKAASTGGAGRGGTPLDFDALLA